MEEVQRLKARLDAEEKEDELLETLDILAKCDVSLQIIKETRIGKSVGKLRKHSNNKIATASGNLVEKWKKIVTPESSTSTSPKESRKESNGNSSDGDKSGKEKKRKKEDEEEENSKKKIKKEKGDTSEHENNDSKTPSKEVKSEGKPSAPTPTPQKKISDEDSIRQKVAEGLVQALGKQPEDILEAEDVSKEIEQELFKMYNGIEKQYKIKYRSLAFNLKNPKNPDLRAAVMNGATSASSLCKMSAQDMASPELKQQRRKYELYHLEAAKTQQGVSTSTDMFKCSKCGKRETTYYQLQTRSADEPMTTFHTCVRCGHRWKS